MRNSLFLISVEICTWVFIHQAAGKDCVVTLKPSQQVSGSYFYISFISVSLSNSVPPNEVYVLLQQSLDGKYQQTSIPSLDVHNTIVEISIFSCLLCVHHSTSDLGLLNVRDYSGVYCTRSHQTRQKPDMRWCLQVFCPE